VVFREFIEYTFHFLIEANHSHDQFYPLLGHEHSELFTIENIKKYKSPNSDQISAELIQAGGEILVSVIHKHIHSIWNKEKLPDQWKNSITVPIHKNGEKAVIIIVEYRCYWTTSVVWCSEFLATDPEVSGSIPGATRFCVAVGLESKFRRHVAVDQSV
jgi:hypothetical protein